MERDLWKRLIEESYICEKRPIKETYICEKRPVKETYICEKRPMKEGTCVVIWFLAQERGLVFLVIWKETYKWGFCVCKEICEKDL